MVRYIKTLVLALILFTMIGCGGKMAEEAPQENTENSEKSGLEAARNAGISLNPQGSEFVLEDEGIYMLLPDSSWEKTSEEDGCVGFSDGKNYINIYYADDDGSTYKNVPKKESDIIKILNDANIPSDQLEILNFNSTEEEGAKIYSYTIKFKIPTSEGDVSEFYSVSRSICTKDKVYVVVGQIYDENNVSNCETAEETFTIF